jgi:hypothetical protein
VWGLRTASRFPASLTAISLQTGASGVRDRLECALPIRRRVCLVGNSTSWHDAPVVLAERGIDDLKTREVLTKETAITCEKAFRAYQCVGADQEVTGYSLAPSALLPV